MCRCRTDFKIAPTRMSSVQLGITVPPEKPVIYDEFNKPVQHKLGPYRYSGNILFQLSLYSKEVFEESKTLSGRWQSIFSNWGLTINPLAHFKSCQNLM